MSIFYQNLFYSALSQVRNMTLKSLKNFPNKLFFIFIPIQTTFYVILQWRLLSQYQKSNKQIEVQNQLNIVIKWIKIFTSSSSLFVIGYFILIDYGNLFKKYFQLYLVSQFHMIDYKKVKLILIVN